MNVSAEHEEVWVASMADQPGALGDKLTSLASAGANLECIIARRSHERPGTAVVFVTPLRGEREEQAALDEGFSVSCHLHAVRVEGQNEPGMAAKITELVRRAGLTLRGFSGAVIGERFVLHLAFDTVEAAQRAIAEIEHGAWETNGTADSSLVGRDEEVAFR